VEKKRLYNISRSGCEKDVGYFWQGDRIAEDGRVESHKDRSGRKLTVEKGWLFLVFLYFTLVAII
jgi:hypothetical protein